MPATAAPNIVILLADDLGYGDLTSYGAKHYTTPNIDQMGREGVRLTRFYAASSVCSSSRAALLTGCYPLRVGIEGVISANVNIGIADNEITLAEMLKAKGYATAIFGKWHLGNQEQFLPSRHGFDHFLGTRGSNDMGKGKPSLEMRRQGLAGVELIEGDHVIELNPDQRLLTKRYTQKAVAFIEQSAKADQNFFLYIPYNMPHTPLFVSDEYAGKTKRGLFGDVIQEIDGSVGAILQSLKTNNLDDNTLVFFTSDNGPWLIFGNHGGSAGELSGGKKQLLEGGVRVPCVIRFPGQISPGRTLDQLASMIDLYPTIAHLAGAALPAHPIDGHNLWPLLTGAATTSPRQSFYYYWREELHAITDGRYKLRFSHIDTQAPDPNAIGNDGVRGDVISIPRKAGLFDLHADPAEQYDITQQHPDIANRLKHAANVARHDLGDSLQKIKGAGRRKAGLAK